MVKNCPLILQGLSFNAFCVWILSLHELVETSILHVFAWLMQAEKGTIMKSVGVVEASPEIIFEQIMSLESTSRYQWDNVPLFFYFFNCCCCKVWFLKLYYDLLYKGSNWSGLWRIQFFLILVPNLIKVWSSMLILSIFLSIGFCSFRWDILTGNLELVEQIDGHTDVVYGSFDPKYYKRFVFFQQAFYYSQIYRILMYFSISECRHHSSSLFYWANQPHCWAYLLIPFILYTSLYIFLKVLDNGIHL